MSDTVIASPAAKDLFTSDRRWSPRRLAGSAVLGSWAALFWFLLLTGRDALYLSTRTAWVVPTAAILLTAGALGRAAAGRVVSPEPLPVGEAWVMGLMVLPVVVVLVLPPATLGGFAAGSRANFSGRGLAVGSSDADAPLTFVDVAAAQTTPEGERALAARAGETVTLIGFVMRFADTPADEVRVTRYIITCCVSDATIAQVRVVNVPAGQFEEEEWVQVTGTVFPLGREVIINANEVVSVPRPDPPYLTP
jgi:uncharacterized repeat protein (TIGR03943 family)